MPRQVTSRRMLAFAIFLSSVTLLWARGATQRVRFAPGKISATLKNAVVRGDRDQYIVGAKAAQTMKVVITSSESNAVFQIGKPRGGYLPGAAEGNDAKTWSGTLPVSGDYTIVVGGTRGSAEYALTITID